MSAFAKFLASVDPLVLVAVGGGLVYAVLLKLSNWLDAEDDEPNGPGRGERKYR